MLLELASNSLPPMLAQVDRGYVPFHPGVYVGIGFLLGLLVGYGWFRKDATAWWQAYRRARAADEPPALVTEPHGKKE